MARYFGIIAAAGTGTRFGGKKPKQYETLDNLTILEKSIHPLLACDFIEKIIVALHSEDIYWEKLSIAKHPKISTTPGAELRAGSVYNALRALEKIARPEDFVLIHDAARPYVSKKDILSLIEATRAHEVGGILAVPVTDTIKFTSDGTRIKKTVPREGLYRALTPQCFRYEKLLHALTEFSDLTDDAMALELAGFEPLLVLGDPKNIKITYREDL